MRSILKPFYDRASVICPEGRNHDTLVTGFTFNKLLRFESILALTLGSTDLNNDISHSVNIYHFKALKKSKKNNKISLENKTSCFISWRSKSECFHIRRLLVEWTSQLYQPLRK